MPYFKIPLHGQLNAATYPRYSTRCLGEVRDTDLVVLNRCGVDFGIKVSDLFSGYSGGGGGSPLTNTDGLPEGVTNKYFTTPRVQQIISQTSIGSLLDVQIGSVYNKSILAWNTTINKWALLGFSLENLLDVNTTSKAHGSYLSWDTTVQKWVPTEPQVLELTLDELTNVDTTGKTQGSILAWNQVDQEWTAGILNAVTTVNGLGPGPITLTTSNIAQGTNLYATPTNIKNILNTLSVNEFQDINLTGLADGTVLTWVAANNQFRPLSPGQFAVTVAMGDISNVNLTGLQNNQYLKYNSSTQQWIPSTILNPTNTDGLPGGSVNFYFTNTRFDTRLSQSSINSLVDVDTTNKTNGSLLSWNSAQSLWVATNLYIPDSLNNLSDVVYSTSTILNNQVLGWNSATSKFVPITVLTESITTTSIPEGANKYYTDARVDTRISQATLSALSNVDASSIIGNVLIYNTVSGVNSWRSKHLSLDDLIDVSYITTPQQGQTLIYDAALQAFLPASGSISEFSLTYEYIGDTKGIFYFLGTSKYRSTFANPSTKTAPYNVAPVLSSNLSGNSASSIFDRTPTTIIETLNSVNSSVSFNFGSDKSIKPNYYTIRGRTDVNTNQLRSWVLEGSFDSLNWTVLDTRSNILIATNLSFQGTCSSTEFYKYLRLRQTNVNSSGTNNLCISEVEFYGTVTISGDIPITSTDDLPQGTNNLYFSTPLLLSYLNTTSIDAFSDVNLTGIQNNNILIWNGSALVPSSISSILPNTDGILEGTNNKYLNTAALSTMLATMSIDAFSDVNLAGIQNNNILVWNGSALVPSSISSSLFSGTMTNTGLLYYNNGAVSSTGLNYLAPSIILDLTASTVYTLLASDHGKIITTSSAITITLPSDLPIGFQVTVFHMSTNTVTFTTTGSLLSSGTLLKQAYTGVYLTVINSSTWLGIGSLSV